MKNSPLLRGLDEIRLEMRKLGDNAMRFGETLAGIGAAIIAPIAAATVSFAQMGSALNDVAKRTGMSVTAVAEFKYAAEMSAGSIDKVEGSVKKLQDTITQAAGGSKTAEEALRSVGTTAQKLKGMLPEEQLQVVADGIAGISDPAKRTAAAMDVLGKSGADLLGMFAELRKLRQEARDLGLVPTENAIKDAAEIGDLFNQISSVAKAAIFEIGSAVAPVMKPFLEVVRGLGSAMVRLVKENSQAVLTVAKIGAGFLTAGTAIYGFGRGMNFVLSGMDRLQAALAPFDVISPLLRNAATFSISMGNAATGAFNRVASAVGTLATRSTQVVGQVASLMGRLTGSAVRLATSFASSAFAAGRSLYNGIASQVTRLVSQMPGMMNSVVAAVRTAMARASSAGSAFNREMRYWLGRPFQYFKSLMPILASDFSTAWQNAGVRVRAIMTTAADGMRAAWSAASARLSAVVGQVTSFIAGRWAAVANPLVARVVAAWTSMASAVSSRVTAAWGAITAKLGPIANRIGSMLKPILPLLAQDFARIAGYARTGFAAATAVARAAAGGVVGAFRAAGPMIARGLVAAASGAFSRIRSMGAATAGAMGRGIGSGARGIGSAMSGVAGLISMMGSGAGGVLGQIAGVVPQLLMVGSSLAAAVNPATLLIAAIGGGVYLWTQYSEQGQAALKSVMAALEPFVAIFKKTISGVYDAIKGGDLALAGKIAITGLKLVFMEGMDSLGDLLGGGVGKAFKRIGGQIAGGDFAGAWKTAVASMGAMWDLFSANIVKAMSRAIGYVVGMWRVGVTSISDFLLEASAGGGAMGAVASAFLGRNMKDIKDHDAVMEEANRLPAIRNQERMNLAHQKSLEEAKAAGNQKEIDRFTKSLEMGVAKLAELRGGKTAGPSFDEAMKQAGHEAFEASDWTKRAAEYEAELKRIEEAAIAAAKASGDNLEAALPDDTAERDARKKELEAKLEALRAEAAKKRKEVEDKAAGADQPPSADDLPTSKDMKNFGTFSGQALMLGGNDGGAMMRIAKAAEEQKKLAAELLKKADEQRAAFDRAASMLSMS